MYNFGLYHWRVRGRRLLGGLLIAGAGTVALGRGEHRSTRVFGGLAAGWGGYRAVETARRLCSPPPWHVERGKYEALASTLPLASAGTVVDVGCGTGRSLVGLAPAIPDDATVLALDVFDDRIILGNGPALARRNAAEAGQRVAPVRADAAQLPVTDGTADVLTACRVLHDLPRPATERALAEARRVLAPDGTLGVLELPYPHEPADDPAAYWHDLVTDAGFTVDEQHPLDEGNGYTVIAATPRP